MPERTLARPVRNNRGEGTKHHDKRGHVEEKKGGSEHTELLAHLPHAHCSFGQLGGQTSSILFLLLVIVNGPVQTQLMWLLLLRSGFLQTLRLEPIRQGSTVIKMGMDETRRSRRLLHAWWEMRGSRLWARLC